MYVQTYYLKNYSELNIIRVRTILFIGKLKYNKINYKDLNIVNAHYTRIFLCDIKFFRLNKSQTSR